jgi:hypothetical protein
MSFSVTVSIGLLIRGVLRVSERPFVAIFVAREIDARVVVVLRSGSRSTSSKQSDMLSGFEGIK